MRYIPSNTHENGGAANAAPPDFRTDVRSLIPLQLQSQAENRLSIRCRRPAAGKTKPGRRQSRLSDRACHLQLDQPV